MQVKSIGWGPRQYAPIHDHPLGGCLQGIIKGPGLHEKFFLKESYKENVKSGQFRAGFLMRNKPKTYSCYSTLYRNKTDTCKLKGQSSANITEIGNANATMEGELLYVEGYDLMHSVHNLNDEHTISMHYYLGEYQISFWLDPDTDNDKNGRPIILKSLLVTP